MIAIYDRKNYSTKNDTRMPLFYGFEIDKIKREFMRQARRNTNKNYATMQFFMNRKTTLRLQCNDCCRNEDNRWLESRREKKTDV